MKTNQIIKREIPITGINGEVYEEAIIRQRTKDGYFNATNLLNIYNKITDSNKKMNDFFRNTRVQELIDIVETRELTKDGISRVLQTTVKNEDIKDGKSRLLAETDDGRVGIQKRAFEKTRGRNGGTWLHPTIFTKFAMWLSPELEYIALKWVQDKLIKFRVCSGDLYKEMSSAIAKHYFSKRDEEAPKDIYRKEANLIKELVGLDKNQSWNEASEHDLQLRNELQKANVIAHNKQYGPQERLLFLQNTMELFNYKN